MPLFYYSIQKENEMICLFPGVIHGGIKAGFGVNEAACWVYDYELPLKNFSPCYFYDECKQKAEANYTELDVSWLKLTKLNIV
jgi:hypothetical protein